MAETAEQFPEAGEWVWFGAPPSGAEVVELLSQLPSQWGVKVVEYIDYVLPFPANQKYERDGSEHWVKTWRLYMTVAGRVKMLNDAAEQQGWKVTEKVTYPADNPWVIRTEIIIKAWTDEDGWRVLGNRFGTSKTKGGDAAWEKAETASRGRAIAAWGIGVLPGSGIASMEEMQDLERGFTEPGEEKPAKRGKDELIADTMTVIEELRQLRGESTEEIHESIGLYVSRNMGKLVFSEAEGFDLSDLKMGQIKLLESNIRSQLRKEQTAQADY